LSETLEASGGVPRKSPGQPFLTGQVVDHNRGDSGLNLCFYIGLVYG